MVLDDMTKTTNNGLMVTFHNQTKYKQSYCATQTAKGGAIPFADSAESAIIYRSYFFREIGNFLVHYRAAKVDFWQRRQSQWWPLCQPAAADAAADAAAF